GLVLAACGGDDDAAADTPVVEQPVAREEPAAADPTDAAGSDVGDDGADGDAADAGAADADGGDDGDGPTGLDDVQESLDDAGVDLDLEELEETIGNFSTGEGGGVVTIDGVAYTFGATAVCIFQGTDFVAEGLGQDPDGNP